MPEPQLTLSPTERELIRLLALIILEHYDLNATNLNVAQGHATLSNDQAKRLFQLLNNFTESREFRINSRFLESLSLNNLEESREIYLSERQRGGRARIMSSYHWSEFLVRMGLSFSRYPYSRTVPMTKHQFNNFERRLLRMAGLDETIQDLVLLRLRKYLPELEHGARKLPSLPYGTIRSSLLNSITDGLSRNDHSMPTTRVAGALALVVDFGVLFTTRDWNVVGTLSAMAGWAAIVVLPSS